MLSNNPIADQLEDFASKEYIGAKNWIDELDSMGRMGFLVEVCRAMDYQHVLQFNANNPAYKLSVPDFDIIVRGWNPALGLLLSDMGELKGIPCMESTPETLGAAITFLRRLGIFYFLKHTAEMIRHEMATGSIVDGEIVVEMVNHNAGDHFLDKVDIGRLKTLDNKTPGPDFYKDFLAQNQVQDLDSRMQAVVFPWDSGHGVMIGYHSETDVDSYFAACMAESGHEWRLEAGIHVDALIGKSNGADLAGIGLLLASWYLEHMRYVELGKRKIPEANYPMSLTIWKPDAELRDSLVKFTGLSLAAVSGALDLLIVKPEHADYFKRECTPYIPMLIQVSEGYLLSPVSSIFRNPLHGVRMLQEDFVSITGEAFRVHREKWMIDELAHIFLGNRYCVVDAPVCIRRNGVLVTDIDAAILDLTTGELALFQLKWQDFNTNEVRKQKSKAKNFVDQIDDWARKVNAWLQEYGVAGLVKELHFKAAVSTKITAVRLFAIGRTAARFGSYGYIPVSKDIAVCSWAQFVRIRYQVGPAANVFQLLHARIQNENAGIVETKPMPYEMTVAGRKIILKNLWMGIKADKTE